MGLVVQELEYKFKIFIKTYNKMSSSREDKTSRRFQIFILSILAISVVFGLVVALWNAIKNNNTTSAPVHYYSAPAYHVASPVHSRYASPNYDPDLSSPAASRYAPAGPQSCPTSDPSVCCDCDGSPASSPQSSSPQSSSPQSSSPQSSSPQSSSPQSSSPQSSSPQSSSPQSSSPQSSSPQSSSPQGCDEDGNYCDPENPIIGCDNTEFCTKGKNKCSSAWYLGSDIQCSGSPFVCEDNNTILSNSALGIPCSELAPAFCGISAELNADQTDDEIWNICPVTCGICSSSPVGTGPVTAPTSSPQPAPVAVPQPVPVPVAAPQPVPVAAPRSAPQPAAALARVGPIRTTLQDI